MLSKLNKRLVKGLSTLRGDVISKVMGAAFVCCILSIAFLATVLPKEAVLFILKDNQAYDPEASNPFNNDAEDKAYLERVEYTQSLINSKNNVVAGYYSHNVLGRLGFIALSITPFVVMGYMRAAKKEKINRIAMKKRAIRK